MCGAALVAPLLMAATTAATSLIGGSKGGGNVESYTPAEQQIISNNPPPEQQEPTFGVNNTVSKNQENKGKSALKIERNPGIGVPGGVTGSGVSVPKG